MIARRDPTRSERNGRRRVAFRRFGHNIFLRKVFEQFPHRRFLFDIGQNQNAFLRHQSVQTRDRFFEERLCPKRAAAIVSDEPGG